jgi:ABC-type branched-subunit amino acid transport system substrate-binding protein
MRPPTASTRALPLGLATIAAALALGITSALAASAADPGVTPTSVLLGATAPLSGDASSYAAIARGMDAYLRHQNARGGVADRQIGLRLLDDAHDPAQTEQATRTLVEQDRVFAIVGAFGTEQNLATRDYLKSEGVPQLFVASGATAFGADADEYPGTIGFQPSYQAEGAVYGRYLARTRPGARVAVLFQGDTLGQDMLAGLRRGLARSKARVVAAQSTAAGADLAPQLAKLKASGADVLALFATRSPAAQALVALGKLGWKPKLTILAAASAGAGVVSQAGEGAQAKLPNGAISLAFVKDPTDPRWRNDATMKLYRSVMKRYAPGLNANDVLHVHGMAIAWTTVELLRRTGRNLTREGVIEASWALSMPKNPFLLPGIAIRTGKSDHYPVEQMLLERWSNGSWRTFGGIWSQPTT